LKRGPRVFRLKPKEAGKTLVQPILHHAAATGLQKIRIAFAVSHDRSMALESARAVA
jgi:hypothetical protein